MLRWVGRAGLLLLVVTTLGARAVAQESVLGPRLAEAGSVGGTLGRGSQDLTGDAASPQGKPAKPAPKPRPKATAKPAPAERGVCGKIPGSWNSWAALLFGRGDTNFTRGGVVTHKSGISGSWNCIGTNLTIHWNSGKTEQFTIAAEGNRITRSDGIVGFRR